MNWIFILFFLAATDKVYSLDCYHSELSYNESGLISPTIINCENHMNDLELTREFQLSCYKITFIEFSETASKNIAIQMCSYQNQCKNFTERIALGTSNIISSISCIECNGNLCNSKKADTIVNKSASSFRKSLYIGAAGCGVIGAVGGLLHCLCCRKFKNRRTVSV